MTTTLSSPILSASKIEIILRGTYKQAPGYLVAKLTEVSRLSTTPSEAYAAAFALLSNALPGKLEADVVSKQIAASI